MNTPLLIILLLFTHGAMFATGFRVAIWVVARGIADKYYEMKKGCTQ